MKRRADGLLPESPYEAKGLRQARVGEERDSARGFEHRKTAGVIARTAGNAINDCDQ